MPKGSTHKSNLRVGQETGAPSTRTVGGVVLFQKAVVSAVASVAAHVFAVPASADICRFEIDVASAMNTAATVRFGAVGGSAGDRYGSVAISGVGGYVITTPSTALTWRIGASSQPIGYTVIPQSGAATMAINNVEMRIIYGIDYRTFDT